MSVGAGMLSEEAGDSLCAGYHALNSDQIYGPGTAIPCQKIQAASDEGPAEGDSAADCVRSLDDALAPSFFCLWSCLSDHT